MHSWQFSSLKIMADKGQRGLLCDLQIYSRVVTTVIYCSDVEDSLSEVNDHRLYQPTQRTRFNQPSKQTSTLPSHTQYTAVRGEGG